MSDEENDEDLYESSKSGFAGILAGGAAAVGGALLVGLAVGAGAAWLLLPPEVVEQQVPRDLTAMELEAACEPLVSAALGELTEAEQKVATLEGEVRQREARVEELEAEMARRGRRGAELVRQLEEARAELEVVRAQLVVAVEQRDQLMVELRHTQEELTEQIEHTRVAREDALGRQWAGFVREAQLEVCERGNRRRMGRCREAVTGALDGEVMQRFLHCVRAGQEAPTLKEAGRNEQLPQFAAWLDEDERATRGWYIQLCDPTLPEADWEDLERPLPPPAPLSADAFEDLD